MSRTDAPLVPTDEGLNHQITETFASVLQADRSWTREIRADNLKPKGERLRYIQCPQTPYIGSSENFVCEGK